MNMRHMTIRAGTMAMGLVAMLLVGSGCASDRAVISQATQMHDGLKPAVMEDPQLTQYIQTVGQRIIAAAQEMHQQQYGPEAHRKEDASWMFSSAMQFHFVNSKTLNAFTTGGEHMYIYNELFQQCQTEDELAAVMAHEFAHVYARHVHKGMNRQLAITGAAVGAGAAGYAAGGENNRESYAAAFAGAAAVVGNFIGMGFTRSDETEADELGFAFYTRAGWDPNRFGDFFQHMIDKGYDTTPEYLSDHPTLKGRVEATRQRAAQLPATAVQWRRAPVASSQQFAALQARAREVGKAMPNDETLQKAQLLAAAFPSCVTPVDQPEQKNAQQQLLVMLKGKPQSSR